MRIVYLDGQCQAPSLDNHLSYLYGRYTYSRLHPYVTNLVSIPDRVS